jgi:ketosteroid isomerase-like protein
MTEPVSRANVEAFYAAYVSGVPGRIEAFLDDDVEWHVTGPVDVIQVCGSWYGRAAVIDRFARLVPSVISARKLDIEELLVDGDRSAMFGRMSSRHCPSGRVISHRVSHIVRYRDSRVVYFRVVNDSFDAAEQFLGHRINVGEEGANAGGDLVAI